jgi:histone deacetylase complex subunit SAP18
MSAGDLNRADTPPFHLKLFYRTGAFHRYHDSRPATTTY